MIKGEEFFRKIGSMEGAGEAEAINIVFDLKFLECLGSIEDFLDTCETKVKFSNLETIFNVPHRWNTNCQVLQKITHQF